MQGARILRNEAYFSYAAMTKDEVQHSRMTFYEAVMIYCSGLYRGYENAKNMGES